MTEVTVRSLASGVKGYWQLSVKCLVSEGQKNSTVYWPKPSDHLPEGFECYGELCQRVFDNFWRCLQEARPVDVHINGLTFLQYSEKLGFYIKIQEALDRVETSSHVLFPITLYPTIPI
jgi:hypothetical protein